MKKYIVFIPDNKKIVIKNGSAQPDPQFLIIHAADGKYKFPWQNVICVFEEKE